MVTKMGTGTRTAAALIFMVGCCLFPGEMPAASEPRYRMPEGVYIELTREFYEALEGRTADTNRRIYSNDPRHDYLRRTAVSSEFTVKTNLTIIKQQERIIRLLESLRAQQERGK
jgi:hypothetical protein